MQPLRDLSPGAPAQPATKRQPFGGPRPRPPRREPDYARHPSFEVPIQRALEKGRTCIVPGCYKPREDFAEICCRHRNRRRTFGHVTAGNFPRRLLGPLIVYTRRYLAQLQALPENHAARHQYVLAMHALKVFCARADDFESIHFRPGQSLDLRTKRWLANVVRHGFGPERLLEIVVALYAARSLYPAMIEDQPHFLFQLSRATIGAVTLRKPDWRGKGEAEVMGWRLAQHVGGLLHDRLGTFAAYAAAAVLGQPFGTFPALEDERPVAPSAAAKAATRPRPRPLDDEAE